METLFPSIFTRDKMSDTQPKKQQPKPEKQPKEGKKKDATATKEGKPKNKRGGKKQQAPPPITLDLKAPVFVPVVSAQPQVAAGMAPFIPGQGYAVPEQQSSAPQAKTFNMDAPVFKPKKVASSAESVPQFP